MKELNRDEYFSECYSEFAHNVRKPHKHAELIKAWADGAEIEERYIDKDNQDFYDWVEFNGDWSYIDNYEYRIKPEPKPDDVTYLICDATGDWVEYGIHHMFPNHKGVIKVTFDGETGELKSAEVLK